MTNDARVEGPMPCPWCDSKPTWLSKSMNFGTGASGMEAPMRALGCNNAKCAVKPRTAWRDTQEYVGPGEKRSQGYTM